MKPEYDFSKGERGKFYRPDMRLHIPIYLDSELQDKLMLIARDQGKDLDELVAELLRQDVDQIESTSR